MSGFTVADLIKPTLESVNSSRKQQLYEGSRKVKTRENANSENRNIKQKNNHDNNVYNRSVILDPLNVFNVDKNSLDRVCSTENNVGKKSDIDNDSTVLSCNLNSENQFLGQKLSLIVYHLQY
ncbi:unnamed protein product [Heterobilharzia americana]|nr:unnamed protein product [Heterobilharzia americana]